MAVRHLLVFKAKSKKMSRYKPGLDKVRLKSRVVFNVFHYQDKDLIDTSEIISVLTEKSMNFIVHFFHYYGIIFHVFHKIQIIHVYN